MAKHMNWHKTACNLCFSNCGIEVALGGEDDRQILKVRGDKAHPKSKGYICNKVSRLDYYQNSTNRLLSPLKRKPDGRYEEISWDQAITEIADKFAHIRDTLGGDKIFFYGGGGQGNHIGATYAPSLLAALGAKYTSNPASQEKSGWSYAFTRMAGGPIHAELEDAEVVLFSGKNPFMSHGMDRGRTFLSEIKRDPNRKLIVLDPRRSETTDFADIHLAVRHGRDAWCLSAIIAQIVQAHDLPIDWLSAHTNGYQDVIERFSKIPVKEYADFCGVPYETIVETASVIANASSFAHEEDIGLQMAPDSTLNSYLDLLLQLITGNFGRPGTMGLALQLGEAIPSDRYIQDETGRTHYKDQLPVTGGPIVAGLYPAALLGEELDSDNDAIRPRGIIIESSNPVHCLPGSDKVISGLRKLDCSICIDVAFTETARECDYVLPASTQYEKWEATYFPRNYPENIFHLRKPVLEPAPNTLPEAEIYARIIDALGIVEQSTITSLRATAERSMDEFETELFETARSDRKLKGLVSYLLYRTLGSTLPKGEETTAVLWGLCRRFVKTYPELVARAGFSGKSAATAMFNKLRESPSGAFIAISKHEEVFDYLATPDKRLNLVIPEMIEEIDRLDAFELAVDMPQGFDFVLVAGSRRAYTANCIIRDPKWIKGKMQIELTLHPEDAAIHGIEDGEEVLLETEFGSAKAPIAYDDRMAKGSLSLPNGQGMDFIDENGEVLKPGVWINKLTDGRHIDKFVGTPLHKFVPARIKKIA